MVDIGIFVIPRSLDGVDTVSCSGRIMSAGKVHFQINAPIHLGFDVIVRLRLRHRA